MIKLDAQTHLRQQLGFARFHVLSAEKAETVHIKRVAIQAVIFALEDGVREYCNSTFSLNGTRLSQVLPSYIKKFSEYNDTNFKQRELASLAQEEDSWLSYLAALRDSIGCKLDSGGSARNAPEHGLIASSGASNNHHWQEISIDALGKVLQQAEELLSRHSETDIEY